MNKTLVTALLMMSLCIHLIWCMELQAQRSKEGAGGVIETSFYIINSSGKDIKIQVSADGEELFTVMVPYRGGQRIPERGPAIINGPDARLIEDIEIKRGIQVLRVVEKISGMEEVFTGIESLEIEGGFTIEIKSAYIQLREGIGLPD